MREGARHSSGSTDSTLVKVVVGLAVLAVVAAIAIPNLLSAKVNWNDVAALATLRNLATCQARFQEAGTVDVDGDGIGEFGTFGEMTGADGVRANADATRRGHTVQTPVLSPSLAAVGVDGIVAKSGYCFRVLLPGEDGLPVHEGRAGYRTGGRGHPG